MSKILVLAEKPSVGRDIARVLKCTKDKNGFIEGDKYVVTWALGHLVTLADPEAYDEKYKGWNIEDLPILPDKLKLIVIKKSRRQFNTVKEQMTRTDIDSIVIATDAGREGELVARWIIEKAHVKKPIKRLWISSVTDKAIKDGFSNLKDGRKYNSLYLSAVARAEADWFVGINGTRALTCKYNANLSCGRVQTPTLYMIEKRENEIKDFKPKNYYGIKASSNNIELLWQDSKSHDIKTFNKDKLEKIINDLKDKEGEVLELSKVKKRKFSERLYDLTELQRDANKIFGFSAKETLSIMQKLYENHKVLTYPRTDSRYLTEDLVDTLKDRVRACGSGNYSKFASKILKGKIIKSSSFVDNSKVSDHHAIIPTEQQFMLSSLNEKERKIYDLVVKRFLSVLYPPFEYEQITLKVKIGREDFIAKGKIIISNGWREIYENKFDHEELEDNIKDQVLPNINKGDIIKISKIEKTKGQTSPPKPFNEGTLLSAMENPIKYMKDEKEDLKEIIGDTGGIGTVATRADIIEKLFSTFLIEKRGKDIFITSKGKQLLDLVPKELKTPALTAKWEQNLINISKGSLNENIFIDNIRTYAKQVVCEIKNSEEKFKHDNVTRTRCPECGKYMLEVKGKQGKILICQDRECGYRKGISKITNSRCPNCHKKLELRGEGEGRVFVCSCGYREKLSAFNKRKKNDNGKVNKKDINKYLRKQNKENEDLINNPFAEALANFKVK